MKRELQNAIKRKHRVYAKIAKRGRKPEEWNYVKNIRNETSRMITNAKNEYYTSLGRKLSNNVPGVKTYWSILNRLLSKKKFSVVLSENGQLVSNVEAKANIFNEHFVAQCKEVKTGSTIPTFTQQIPSLLTNLHSNRSMLLRLIESLSANRADGCDGISVAMVKMCHESTVEPLSCMIER